QASKVEGDYEKTNAWKIAPASNSIHPAIFPKELAARVIQFYSFKGDLVFDPFGGSGTVGEIALSLDRFFFLVEKDEQYINYTRQRLSSGTLFSQVHPRLYTFDQFESLMQRQD
ncbi:MAG: site-specific DNA-methyltransferase, partial [Chloroflexi bacterium]|nr:site-specific DNA-methyltransferase [Chloroflexota bacterium]